MIIRNIVGDLEFSDELVVRLMEADPEFEGIIQRSTHYIFKTENLKDIVDEYGNDDDKELYNKIVEQEIYYIFI